MRRPVRAMLLPFALALALASAWVPAMVLAIVSASEGAGAEVRANDGRALRASARDFAVSRPRIVSLNPCIDAVLVRVADPAQIAGISHYSHDPEASSIPLELARRFHATSGTAEEVVALAPDQVLTGPHVSPSTIHALERMNIRLVKLTVPETLAQSRLQIRQIAAIAGATERGEQLIAAIDRAVSDARPQSPGRVSALVWQRGGLVPGTGTLADELLGITGYANLSAAYGLKKWDVLPLELLLASPPDLLLSVGAGQGGRDRALGHRAVHKLASRVAIRDYPFKLLQCGGPTIVDALGRLAAIRREIVAP